MVEVVRNPPLSRKKNADYRSYPLHNSAFGKDRLSTKLALSAATSQLFTDAELPIRGFTEAALSQSCNNGTTRSRIPFHFRDISRPPLQPPLVGHFKKSTLGFRPFPRRWGGPRVTHSIKNRPPKTLLLPLPTHMDDYLKLFSKFALTIMVSYLYTHEIFKRIYLPDRIVTPFLVAYFPSISIITLTT